MVAGSRRQRGRAAYSELRATALLRSAVGYVRGGRAVHVEREEAAAWREAGVERHSGNNDYVKSGIFCENGYPASASGNGTKTISPLH